MLYQIVSLSELKDLLGAAVDAETLVKLLPELIETHGAVIIYEYTD